VRQQSVPAGDQPGHAFTLAQGKCVPKEEVGGAMSKEATFAEHGEVMGHAEAIPSTASF
jgi:hypothetical protein